MKVGDTIKLKNGNDKGYIVKIWWDGTIRVQWDWGHHSLCSIADVVILATNRGKKYTVRMKK